MTDQIDPMKNYLVPKLLPLTRSLQLHEQNLPSGDAFPRTTNAQLTPSCDEALNPLMVWTTADLGCFCAVST